MCHAYPGQRVPDRGNGGGGGGRVGGGGGEGGGGGWWGRGGGGEDEEEGQRGREVLVIWGLIHLYKVSGFLVGPRGELLPF